ncbi:hypothetical protein ROZALSC1DRAFT_27229 [Rozella allomycis CSF55]|uniref:DUF4211 domain-containing protein n=1 Tax=Rozella allomycis (strain CSF55) TaxID=988480 RepID=A0A4P9YQ32_ROZAC|nr:hypothetical protein ROZALSC1DRAFT_27229 [Rozella allomycis CSF55]
MKRIVSSDDDEEQVKKETNESSSEDSNWDEDLKGFVVENEEPETTPAFQIVKPQSEKYYFQITLQLLVSHILDNTFLNSVLKNGSDVYFSIPYDKIKMKIEDYKNMLSSDRWSKRFKAALELFPRIEDLTLSDTDVYLQKDSKCECCHKKRLIRYELNLKGTPYSTFSFKRLIKLLEDKFSVQEDNQDDDTDISEEELSERENEFLNIEAEEFDDSDCSDIVVTDDEISDNEALERGQAEYEEIKTEPNLGKVRANFLVDRYCNQRALLYHKLSHYLFVLLGRLVERIYHLSKTDSKFKNSVKKARAWVNEENRNEIFNECLNETFVAQVKCLQHN